MDQGVGGITPTSQWRPTQSWWVGDDARSDDGGSNLLDNSQLAPTSPDRRRSQQVATLEIEPEADRAQQPQDGVPVADPLCMFGPLPNSSFSGALDNPVQRELERRDAEEAVVAPQRRLSSDAGRRLAVSFADTAGLRSEGDGGNSSSRDFWRDECGRLQVQLASLATEKERWERDRRRLLAEDVDRARDIEGLKRAVEAQSQLVMENLVAAQRLAAMGAGSVSDRGRAPDDDLLQYAWVPPSVATPRTTGSRLYESGVDNSRTRPLSREDSMSPRAEAITDRVRDGYARSGGRGGTDSERRLSHRSTTIVNAAAASPQSPAASVVAADGASPRRDSDTEYPVLSYVMSRDPPAATSDQAWRLHQHQRPTAAATGNGSKNSNDNNIRNEDRATPSSSVALARPTSTGMVLAPSAAALTRRYTPQLGAAREVHDSTAYNDQPQTGWRRVVSRGDVGGRRGITAGRGAGGEAAEGRSEVWEWNGRRVLVHVARPRQPPGGKGSEGQPRTAGEQEDATQAEPRTDVRIKPSAAAEPPATAAGTERPRSIVPTSLLIDIEETRATVQALAAGAVTVPFQEPLTDSEQATAIGATTSGRGEGLGLANPGQLQPKPPDTTRYQRSEPSFDHQTGSTARRRRSGMPPAQEPGGGASTAESSPGGADGSQRERRPEEASGSAQNETPESSSEAGQAPIGGNRRTGSGSGGSAGIALPAGGADEKGGDGGDGSGDRAYGRPPPRSGRHGVDDYYRPRNKPPEEIATDPPIREQGGGRNFMPATDENPPLALLAGEGVGEQGRRSPSPSGSCSGSSSTPARIGRGGVVNKAGGDAGEEPSLAEDVVAAGTDGTSPAHPAGGSDDDDGGVVVAVGDAMIQKRGTTGGTAAEDMPREEAVEELTPQEGSN